MHKQAPTALDKPDFKHSYTRRHRKHDYYSASTYHIIFKKAKEAPLFSKITGDARIAPGQPGCASVEWSPLGRVIANTIHSFPKDFPIVAMYSYCVMPDHVHILLRIKERSDLHLGMYMAHLSGRIAKGYGSVLGREISSKEIFENNYTDKVIYADRKLDDIYSYIRENPHRLAMRRQYPHFFRRVRKLKIGEHEYDAYGNLFLFRNPDKEAVKISRRFSAEEKERSRQDWLSEADKGTVLVSPFISKEERGIRAEAEAAGGKIILITHEAFSERYKPSAHDSELCSCGRLLILTLGMPAKTPLSREICVRMNTLAAEIAGKSGEKI